jgi:hypothetical protein
MKEHIKAHLFLVLTFLTLTYTFAQSPTPILQGKSWNLSLNTDGSIRQLVFNTPAGSQRVQFRHDSLAGPAFVGKWDGQKHAIRLMQTSALQFEAKSNGLLFKLQYLDTLGLPAIKASVKNMDVTEIQPDYINLRLGINTEMKSFPQWDSIYFPTLLRCELAHFWGYFSTPNGGILGIASPNPIASWSHVYNDGYGSDGFMFKGHRVLTSNLSLMHKLPLPPRHPQGLYSIKRGEEKKWLLFLTSVPNMDKVADSVAVLANAPSFHIPQPSMEHYRKMDIFVKYRGSFGVIITTPGNKIFQVPVRKAGKNRWYAEFQPVDGPGDYKLEAVTFDNRKTEAIISVHKPWSWYLQQARKQALVQTQKASWNCESLYGFYSMYLDQIYNPNDSLLKATNQRFNKLWPLLVDTLTLQPLHMPDRIQNTSTLIGILVAKYRATGQKRVLEQAGRMADWLIAYSQSADGAFRRGHTHYTSVIYPAKSLMELMAEEKKQPEGIYKKRYKAHYKAVEAAMEQLLKGEAALDTEGQLTFEDGMISCTALQLGAFALLQEQTEKRKRYADTMLHLLDRHSCLTQTIIPDSRMRGATLRFWEAQYDVMLYPNMLNSPHGWSSWRTYATWYAWQLTGDEKWLHQTLSSLGSSCQLIQPITGELRWAFVPDPYVEASQAIQNLEGSNADVYNHNQYHPLQHPVRNLVIGEQYVGMVADWYNANTSDNDVHEAFKCLEETMLKNCVVLEDAEGNLKYYNCAVDIVVDGTMTIIPDEPMVETAYIKLSKTWNVKLKGTGTTNEFKQLTGFHKMNFDVQKEK